jgi:sugar transferase (PEP-CTERM/EpsH1 system associated)
MKILFVCHRFPYPADGGGKIRALKMIEHLQREHDVHVFSMTRDSNEREGQRQLTLQVAGCTAPAVSQFETLCSLLMGWVTGKSASEAYFCPPSVRTAMRRLLDSQPFDMVVAHCSSIGPLIVSAKAPRLLDFCDMDSMKWSLFAGQGRGLMRWVHLRESKAVRQLEKTLAVRLDACTTATPAELKILEDIAPEAAQTGWFGNGVDSRYFSPIERGYDPMQLCFVGRMDYLPNIDCVEWFVQNCWSSIRAKHPGARFVIIGAAPTERVKALSEIEGIEVTGTVPDVRPHLGRSVAMVAPLRIARGVQNKLLEAMAMGVPVVTSRQCAEALDPDVSSCVMKADKAEEVTLACLTLIDNAMVRRERSVIGRKLVRTRSSWGANLRRLDDLLWDLVSMNPIQKGV